VSELRERRSGYVGPGAAGVDGRTERDPQDRAAAWSVGRGREPASGLRGLLNDRESWDWFHINAVHIDTDGNLLIDARDTWTTYKVDRFTGRIIWQLGGKASSFKLAAAPGQSLDDAGDIFAGQHDPEAIGRDTYTFFDNESAGTPEFSVSRAVTVKLDTRNRVATLVASDDQPEGLVAASQGNAQTTPDGGLFVGWGALPYFSEFDPSGRLVFNAEFTTGVNTYRAYVLPWRPGSSR
jgi:hypothetical protein